MEGKVKKWNVLGLYSLPGTTQALDIVSHLTLKITQGLGRKEKVSFIIPVFLLREQAQGG